jgi:hypothetical protein
MFLQSTQLKMLKPTQNILITVRLFMAQTEFILLPIMKQLVHLVVKLNNFADTYEAPNYDLYKGLVAQTGEIDYVEKVIIAEASKYNKSNAAFLPICVMFILHKIIL